MILQRTNKRLIKILFILGFLLLTIGQGLFALTDDFNLLEPIDFIHWTILLGVVLVIPGVLNFSKGIFSKIGSLITFIGIIMLVGMCVVDFVLWSFKDDLEGKNNIYKQLVNEPTIWSVFITIGPMLFFIGLAIQSYDYFKSNLKGFVITNIGVIFIGMEGLILPEIFSLRITGYLLFSVGLILLFLQKKEEGFDREKSCNMLFVIGLFFEMIGQILLAPGNDFVYALKPIDFAHWSLLLGVALMIPKIVHFPNKIITYFGTPLAMIGAICIIGMCVLDFMWWSMPTQEMRSELARHLSQFPSIWAPFITKGTIFLNIGLLVLSFNYFKKNKLGVGLVILATLIIFVGGFIPHRLILVYLMTAIGFAILFNKKTMNEY